MSDTTEKILVHCPSCKKQYQVPSSMAGKQASCKCGTLFLIVRPGASDAESIAPLQEANEYDIPQSQPATSEPAKASPTDCIFHPGTPAAFACAGCRRLVCRKCTYPQHDGRILCGQCALQSASPNLTRSQSLSSVVSLGMCQLHPTVEATERCKYCEAPLCKTCDFRFPHNIHLCARCATRPSTGWTRSRKVPLVGSLVALCWVSLAIAARFVTLQSLPADSNPAVRTIVELALLAIILLPSIAGLGMACGSFSRRLGNPPLVWVSLALNTLMSVLWLVMMLVAILHSSGPPEVPPGV